MMHSAPTPPGRADPPMLRCAERSPESPSEWHLDEKGRLSGPVRTGHAGYDRAAEACPPVQGNAVTPIQSSSYIRAWSDVRANGADFSPGELHAADLRPYRGTVPRPILAEVSEAGRDRAVIFYVFRHWRGARPIVHGYVLTDAEHRLIRRWTTGPTRKSEGVISDAVARITEAPSGHARLEKVGRIAADRRGIGLPA